MPREADVAEQVRNVATRVAHTYGLDIFDVQFRREAGGMILRVQIDRPGPAAVAEESVSVEDCARVSRDLSAVLDVEDVVPTAYTLEVSSPGLDRRLRKAADFARFVGCEAQVRLRQPVNGRKNFTGVVRAVSGERVEFDFDGGHLAFELVDLDRAHLVPKL